ncbi:bifunctional RNase H/acid phosphatase [Streptomyces sp. MC1]|uniref:bifunctional RNase H/acid phosphatase n=1 Tax=Streptomyces sp. MC1 TaxID=295105 RepID=UPI0018CA8453|nr:bifunctional RNase H/acid phosphatase [Streptomyces sp. MC1]MBG7698156.1 bifunctional RNase H/acid phosphatase [Streptomyces sp. MC1]
MREFIVEADGGSRGNPGPAGYGAVVLDRATGEALAEAAEYIGVATNNVAEYRGLLAGLRAAHALDPSARIHVRMDSKLVIEQMSGRWKIKHPDMKPLATEARSVHPPDQVTYEWIPRERNKHADRLANEAMDAGARGRQWSPSRSRAALDTPPPAPEPQGPPGDAAAGAARARAALAEGRAAGATAGSAAGTLESAGATPESAAGSLESAGATPESAAGSLESAGATAESDGATPEPSAAAPESTASAGGRAGGAGPAGERPSSGAVGGRAAEERPSSASAGSRAAEAASVPAEAAPPREQRPTTPSAGRAPGEQAPTTPGEGRPSGSRGGAVDEQRVTSAPGWSAAPDLGAPATLVLLRHGETPLTPQKRFSGSGGTDPSLSAAGREQAHRVAEALARRGTIQDVVASPLARTRETAEIVAARLNLGVTLEDGLRETDFGAWEGLTFGEVRERYPDDLDAWLADPEAHPTGGGESFTETATRIAATRDKLTAAYAGRTVLLVTHVTPIKTFIRLALGAPPKSLFRMELSAASLSAVAYYADGNASVRLFNDTSHLRP